MSIKNFELFHGAVLTKMIRNDKSTSIIMVETEAKSLWALYKINDQVSVYVKYRTKNIISKKNVNKTSWTFSFSQEEFDKIYLMSVNDNIYFAFVCGNMELKKWMEVCFIKRQQFLDLMGNDNKLIHVVNENGKSLRIKSPFYKKGFIIPRNALDEWEIPGR